MTRILLIVILLFMSTNIFGQSQRLKGVIVADSLEGFAINIVNYTKKIGTTNDERGAFEIPAAVNDSIIFSSVQYEVISIIVSERDLDNQNFQLKLYPVIQKLDQVNVSNINLSGSIEKDTKDIKVTPVVNNKTLGLPYKDIKQPTRAERRIYTATASNGILSVDRIINTISGKLKKLKNNKAIEDLKTLIQKGEQSFSTTFFVDALELPENLITDFMYYCAEDDYFKNLLENSKKISLLEFFKQKAISYKKHKEID
ncbi:hypothetical protein [uncultured Aquimarina sp.]|uniref:hypothetical protein n=1 Tax=uncultured Aquimarina sp. TaxID=575652 RepID=UPI00262297B1|nr:hypothetical protein [uncultured Aquimarina sp.]